MAMIIKEEKKFSISDIISGYMDSHFKYFAPYFTWKFAFIEEGIGDRGKRVVAFFTSISLEVCCSFSFNDFSRITKSIRCIEFFKLPTEFSLMLHIVVFDYLRKLFNWEWVKIVKDFFFFVGVFLFIEIPPFLFY